MKLINFKIRPVVPIMFAILGYIGYIASCTHEDQIIEPEQPVNNQTDLISVKVTTPPTIDGTVEAMWNDMPILEFSTVVPDVTGDLFRGYTGNIIPSVKLRSAYDANNIYFLAEWDDPTESLSRSPWYFNPTTKQWKQEKGTFDFDPATNGGSTRKPFYEDKMSMLWNIDNSVLGWDAATCFKSCHTGLPAADGSSRHFTNFPTERIDMWHWKSVRGGTNGGYQIDDQYQRNTYPNGRASDTGTQAYSNNKQDLVITGTATTVSVPKYVIPGRTNYYWVLGSEVDNNTAKVVTAVDAEGVLTLSDASTIDPTVGTDYQRIGSGVGAKAIPGIVVRSYDGNRGDISCKATYTGSGWIMEYQRALKTADAEKQDIDFSSLDDQYFGFAIFENAQLAHSIKANLVLKFKK